MSVIKQRLEELRSGNEYRQNRETCVWDSENKQLGKETNTG